MSMDHILQLHVEHHTSSSGCSGVARLGKGRGDAPPRAVLAFAAIIAILALLLLPSLSSVVTARTALFVLSNAILLLLAADCRWFFSISDDAGASACPELPAGDFLEKHHGRRHHHQIQGEARQCAAQSCVPYSASAGCLLEHDENIGGTASEAFTETAAKPDNDNTTVTSEALEKQEEDAPALVRLEELGIDELNKKFDEFIQSRRNRWMNEESLLAE
ncbi:unnamed protein product [Urochloa decumbens]|uniref:Uncharacterized protein n=1 Tax=Urochloa decumbens TaxID=240449 RepID=A0ABC8XGP7_9POAL